MSARRLCIVHSESEHIRRMVLVFNRVTIQMLHVAPDEVEPTGSTDHVFSPTNAGTAPTPLPSLCASLVLLCQRRVAFGTYYSAPSIIFTCSDHSRKYTHCESLQLRHQLRSSSAPSTAFTSFGLGALERIWLTMRHKPSRRPRATWRWRKAPRPAPATTLWTTSSKQSRPKGSRSSSMPIALATKAGTASLTRS